MSQRTINVFLEGKGSEAENILGVLARVPELIKEGFDVIHVKNLKGDKIREGIERVLQNIYEGFIVFSSDTMTVTVMRELEAGQSQHEKTCNPNSATRTGMQSQTRAAAC